MTSFARVLQIAALGFMLTGFAPAAHADRGGGGQCAQSFPGRIGQQYGTICIKRDGRIVLTVATNDRDRGRYGYDHYDGDRGRGRGRDHGPDKVVIYKEYRHHGRTGYERIVRFAPGYDVVYSYRDDRYRDHDRRYGSNPAQRGLQRSNVNDGLRFTFNFD